MRRNFVKKLKMKSTKELFYKLTLPSKKWQHYFDIYDRHFSPFIGKTPNVLEIGVDKGGSLELWHNFFENSMLYAIDNNAETKNIKFPFRVDIEIGDQDDEMFLKHYVSSRPDFDIIIDDGGHYMQQQLMSLIYLFPKLREGGIYVIEDVHTSYSKGYGGGFRNPNTFVEHCKSLVELLNVEFITDVNPPDDLAKLFFDLNSITFYNSVIVLEKKTRPKILPANVNC